MASYFYFITAHSMLKMIPLELSCYWDKFKFKKTCTLSKPSPGLGDARNTELNAPGLFPGSPQPARYQVAGSRLLLQELTQARARTCMGARYSRWHLSSLHL